MVESPADAREPGRRLRIEPGPVAEPALRAEPAVLVADVLRIEAETSVAEDPTFGFTLPGEPGGELRVEAEDSDGRRFRGAWTLGVTG